MVDIQLTLLVISLNFNNSKFKEFTNKLLFNIYKKYNTTEGMEDFLTDLNDNIKIKNINHNNIISKFKIYLTIIDNLISVEDLKRFILKLKSKYIIHKLSVIRGGVTIIKMINNFAAKCNKKIIFDQLDESNFTPVLDAARYGCFDTFKYLIKRSNIDIP